MNIYRFESGLVIAGGTATVVTPKLNGGLCRQFQLRTESTNTIFKVVFLDKNSAEVVNYGFHTQEINDIGASGTMPIPMIGQYIIRITSASLVTTCSFNLLIQE
jgi:hypothetical protein